MVPRKGSRVAIWGRKLFLLLAIALLLPLAVVNSTPPATVARAQPILLHMAAEHPSQATSIIVQKWIHDSSLEELVDHLGGVVTKDLHIINAFAAELPAGAIPQLARAAGVRWISLDAPVLRSTCTECIDTTNLQNAFVQSIGADQLWNEPPYLQGQTVTVAVVDSGIAIHDDLRFHSPPAPYRVVRLANFSSAVGYYDLYGHGTHVAGTIGGNGIQSNGVYMGVAPKVRLVSVKVTDDQGAGLTSDVVAGLQWIYDHKDQCNIRVVNLSMNSSVQESYHTSPLDAALEILWFNRIVVIVSAGNNGDNGILYPPANDPFVITVGATDDRGTPDIADDTLAPFSAYGITESSFAKPDLVAPGTNIISLLARTGSFLADNHPAHQVPGNPDINDKYFRMSGTSMASAVTAGAVALLLQDEPYLTPDQVKYRLMATARPFNGPEPGSSGAGYLDIYAAVHGTTTESANTGIAASQLLWTGPNPVNWDSVNWGSVNWDSVNWDSVNWDSVNWDSVNWDSVNWDSVNWDE